MAKFCEKCGTELNDNDTFCNNCGNKIESEEVEVEVVENTNSNKDNTNTNYNTSTNSKSKMAAGLLGIFLGALGIHNFYLGYTGKAIGQLLISVLSCGILSGISAIWGLIEGIMILTGSINTDAQGNPLVD